MTEPTPDLDDVLQIEESEGLIVVPVKIVESEQLRVHHIPNRSAVMRGIVVPDGDMQQLVGGNLRRSRLSLWATGLVTGGTLYVGVDKNEVESGTCAVLPIVVNDGTSPFRIDMTHSMPVWVRNVSGNPITVSFLAEEWAD